MTQTYSVRVLMPEDWQDFSAIRLEALQTFPQYFGSHYAKEAAYTKEEWRYWLNPEGRCIFGLCDGQKIIGITGVITSRDDPTGQTGIMIASYIKPEYQGKGLAVMLYKARIEWALDYKPWKTLLIAHRDGNEASRRANQKWGFVFTHREPKTWPDGTRGDEVCYQLNLEQRRQKE